MARIGGNVRQVHEAVVIDDKYVAPAAPAGATPGRARTTP
jgi:hypothetical protein